MAFARMFNIICVNNCNDLRSTIKSNGKWNDRTLLIPIDLPYTTGEFGKRHLL